MKCRYFDNWACQQDGRIDGYCLPHGVLFIWLVEGEGEPAYRMAEHDAIAGLPIVELTATLRNPTWDPRIRSVLKAER